MITLAQICQALADGLPAYRVEMSHGYIEIRPSDDVTGWFTRVTVDHRKDGEL